MKFLYSLLLLMMFVVVLPVSAAYAGKLQDVVYEHCLERRGAERAQYCSCESSKALDRYLSELVYNKNSGHTDRLRSAYISTKDAFLGKLDVSESWLEGFCDMSDEYLAKQTEILNAAPNGRKTADQKNQSKQLFLEEKQRMRDMVSKVDKYSVAHGEMGYYNGVCKARRTLTEREAAIDEIDAEVQAGTLKVNYNMLNRYSMDECVF